MSEHHPDLQDIHRLAQQLDLTATTLYRSAVACVIAGYTYEQVGKAMGISRQGAWAALHELVDEELADLQKA